MRGAREAEKDASVSCEDTQSLESKRKMPGRFAEGPRHPGFILPASAVSEQENREIPRETELLFFVAAQKFVAFDGGNHSDGRFVAGLRALNAAEAANADRTGESDLVRKR